MFKNKVSIEAKKNFKGVKYFLFNQLIFVCFSASYEGAGLSGLTTQKWFK